MIKWLVSNALKNLNVDVEYQHPVIDIVVKFQQDVVFQQTINVDRPNK